MIFAYRQMWDFLSYFYEKCWIVTPFYKRDLLLSVLVYHKERVLFGVKRTSADIWFSNFLPVAYMNKIELWKLKARDGAFRNMVGNCQPQTLQWPGSVLTYDFYIYLGPISDLTWFYICLRLIQTAYAVNCKFFLSTNLPSNNLGQFYNNDIHLDLLMNIVRITINYFIIRNSATNIVTYTVDQKQIDHQIHYFSYNWRIPHLRPWKTCFPSPLFRQTQKKLRYTV